MKYQILMRPDGLVSGLVKEGAQLGNGKSQLEFEREFDGSELVHEFEVPPPPGPWEVEMPPLDEEQCWEIAKTAYEAAMYAAIGALERAPGEGHEVETRMHRELHEALGFHVDDIDDFTWHDLLAAVRKDLEQLTAARKAVEP